MSAAVKKRRRQKHLAERRRIEQKHRDEILSALSGIGKPTPPAPEGASGLARLFRQQLAAYWEAGQQVMVVSPRLFGRMQEASEAFDRARTRLPGPLAHAAVGRDGHIVILDDPAAEVSGCGYARQDRTQYHSMWAHDHERPLRRAVTLPDEAVREATSTGAGIVAAGASPESQQELRP